MSRILSQKFFRRPTEVVARELLGKLLIRKIGRIVLTCRLVETEAYLPHGDSACHASKKKTPKNEVMFSDGGAAYVYAIHGKYCFNIVTESHDLGCAVLIRAAEPITGLGVMHKNRPIEHDKDLLNGPGKLCQSLAINTDVNGVRLNKDNEIWIADDGTTVTSHETKATQRIGVTSAQEHQLRFVIKGSEFASGPKYLR